MYKKFKMWLRFFFGFSRTEANGFVVLSVLMLLFVVLPLFTKHLFSSTKKTPIAAHQSFLLDSLLAQLSAAEVEELSTVALSKININKVSADTLAKYGIPLFLADRIVKYRTHVKPFYQKSDLLKIYGLDSAQYDKISPFILEIALAPEEAKYKNNNQKDNKPVYASRPEYANTKKEWQLAAFDINTADTTQLKKVYGIGTAYAKRIVAFREVLGGFNDISQLSEVYGLKSPALDSLLSYSFVGHPINLQKLSVNSLSAAALAKHPYVSYKAAQLIVAFRNQHGNYLKATDLLQIGTFDSLFVEKIGPYLHFEE